MTWSKIAKLFIYVYDLSISANVRWNLLIYRTESQQDRRALNCIYKVRKVTESYYTKRFYITKISSLHSKPH